MKRDVPKKIAPDIALEKHKLDMTDTTVPIEHEDVQISAEQKKIKYECDDLLKEDVCDIDDTSKLRAYVMCYARRSGDMSKGMKEAWSNRKSCEITSKKSHQQ